MKGKQKDKGLNNSSIFSAQVRDELSLDPMALTDSKLAGNRQQEVAKFCAEVGCAVAVVMSQHCLIYASF
jgi:hypothetical protein